MDVPFLSSSAINREHYNLVQSVEAASTLWQVDEILVNKVSAVRRRFEKRTLASHGCAPLLILLLYCLTATSLGHVTRSMLKFGLPYAVTLAEAGRTTKEKRIGYLFLVEVMDKSDELQLMLVNTLRKDLMETIPARICLALDVLLANCPPDAVPAVTPRLVDLLSHNSPHVRRKVMALVRRLSQHEPVFTAMHEKVILKLKDPDMCVVDAALRLLEELTRIRTVKPLEALSLILADFTSLQAREVRVQRRLGFRFVQVVGTLIRGMVASGSASDMLPGVVATICRMIDGASNADQAFVLECFRTLSHVPVEEIERYLTSNDSKPWTLVGQSIGSTKPNTQFFCVACLLELDVRLWAGVAESSPPAFDEYQVNTIMGFLDSSDSAIRIMTLRVLNRVDRNILSMHLAQLISAFRGDLTRTDRQLAARTLEVAAVYENDGDGYTQRLREVCVRVGHQTDTKGKRNATDGGARLVSEDVVEQVLLHLRTSSNKYRGDFVDAIVRIPASDAGPTLSLIVAAVVCEYGALSSISQNDLLRGLADRLYVTSPAIQEALLLSMLRVTARCGSADVGVSDEVRKVHETSQSHIRRRCDQYLTYSREIGSLNKIVEQSRSDTLPDFLFALEVAKTHPQRSMPVQHTSTSSTSVSEKSQSSTTRTGLRYEAYEVPRHAPKLGRRRSSTTSTDSRTTSSLSGRSDLFSSTYPHIHGREPEPSGAGDLEDPLSRTLTAGDLALAAHKFDFAQSASTYASLAKSQIEDLPQSPSGPQALENLASKTDLIALDTPFLVEPVESVLAGSKESTVIDFRSIWDALKDQSNIRGWCGSTAEELKEHIVVMITHKVTVLPPNIPPYSEELKFIFAISGSPGMTSDTGLLGALRLRPGEEESTLWQMRCFDPILQTELKDILDGN